MAITLGSYNFRLGLRRIFEKQVVLMNAFFSSPMFESEMEHLMAQRIDNMRLAYGLLPSHAEPMECSQVGTELDGVDNGVHCEF